MMHKKNFVVAIKVGGKVLRESSDRVSLPFGSEYSVLLKNLDTVRMQAKIDIDGQEACRWVVIDPGKSVEIERFYRGNNERGNRFKFIERTERVEEHRGVQAEDGLVRVEFKRERVYELPKIVEHHTYYHHGGCFGLPYRYYQPSGNVSSFNLMSAPVNSGLITNTSVSSLGRLGTAEPISANETGITVNGGVSDQKFTSVSGFETEQSEAIVLHLIGRKNEVLVQTARIVQTKVYCNTCGQKNKDTSKFCSECGTFLEQV
jgi:hypothetical protein